MTQENATRLQGFHKKAKCNDQRMQKSQRCEMNSDPQLCAAGAIRALPLSYMDFRPAPSSNDFTLFPPSAALGALLLLLPLEIVSWQLHAAAQWQGKVTECVWKTWRFSVDPSLTELTFNESRMTNNIAPLILLHTHLHGSMLMMHKTCASAA